MRAFVSFLRKEYLELLRSGKLLLIVALFLVFGVMNPAIAKLTPWLLEMMSDSLAESGMSVTGVEVDAITSWTQFFKNIPMALIVFILMLGGIFAKEYETGTFILIDTKGFSRYKVILVKFICLFIVWTIGYWLCFLVTFAYNAYFWDNSVAIGLFSATWNWYLFGVWIICSCVFSSVIFKTYGNILLGVTGIVLFVYVISLFPTVGEYMPTELMNTAKLLLGMETVDVYLKSILIAIFSGLLLLLSSIPIINRKQL